MQERQSVAVYSAFLVWYISRDEVMIGGIWQFGHWMRKLVLDSENVIYKSMGTGVCLQANI